MSCISTILLLSTISAFSQVNRLQLNEKVGIGSYMHPGVARALHINAFPETVVNSFIIDPTIRLSFGDCPVTDCATLKLLLISLEKKNKELQQRIDLLEGKK
jgi:hypothetical protein